MLFQYIPLFCFECPPPLGISRVDRWNNFYLSALAEYDKNWQECPHAKFLLTRPVRGATLPWNASRIFGNISTHTPLARRDSSSNISSMLSLSFLLTRPMRGATSSKHGWRVSAQFLLTRLLRGATMSDYIVTLEALISTHTPLARRDQLIRHRHLLWCISTHTPHAGRDIFSFSPDIKRFQFLLTRPMRGATPKRSC